MRRTDLIAFGTGLIIILLAGLITIGAVKKTQTLSTASYEQGCVDASVSNALHMAKQIGQGIDQDQFAQLVSQVTSFCKQQSAYRAKACEQNPKKKDRLCIQQ